MIDHPVQRIPFKIKFEFWQALLSSNTLAVVTSTSTREEIVNNPDNRLNVVVMLLSQVVSTIYLVFLIKSIRYATAGKRILWPEGINPFFPP